MDEAGVGSGESIGDLGIDLDQLADGDRLAVKEGAERLAFDEFADDVLLGPVSDGSMPKS